MAKRQGDPGYADGWCIHYAYRRSGPQVCEAGVEYSTFRPGNFPCYLDKGIPKPDSDSCDKLRLPTSEEIAAHELWLSGRIGMLGTVMTAIALWRKAHKGRNHAETVECPVCKGNLYLSIAAYNGHVHGACETKGCVSWME